MRIIVLTNLFPNPFQPNRATFNRDQIRALANDHDVSVIAPILWTEELAARWQGKPRLPLGRRVSSDGIPVDHPIYWYTPKILRSRYGHFYLRSVQHTFKRVLTEFRPDILFATWAY